LANATPVIDHHSTIHEILSAAAMDEDFIENIIESLNELKSE
jgi:hypothetical protein